MRLSNWSEKLKHNKWLLKCQNLNRWWSVGQTWVRQGFKFFVFFFNKKFLHASRAHLKKIKMFFKKTFYLNFFCTHACEQTFSFQKKKNKLKFFCSHMCFACVPKAKGLKNISKKKILNIFSRVRQSAQALICRKLYLSRSIS